jgi:UDP-N-acetylmuramyl pentapeptide synthase
VREVPDSDAAAKALVQYLRPGDMVLLKGSRAMGLERILNAFES